MKQHVFLHKTTAMKSLLFTLALLCTLIARADAWDNLSFDEATKVVAYLEKNPFIFQYCDCCDFEGEYATRIFLVKVTSADIVPCEWDGNFFSVHYQYDPVAEVSYTEAGADISQLMPFTKASDGDLVYMNYTWGYNINSTQAEPLFTSVTYSTYGENPDACRTPFAYPTPAQISTVYKSKSYKKWYKKAGL